MATSLRLPEPCHHGAGTRPVGGQASRRPQRWTAGAVALGVVRSQVGERSRPGPEVAVCADGVEADRTAIDPKDGVRAHEPPGAAHLGVVLHRQEVAANSGLKMAPNMLGATGPRRYFLAVQNNAEVRGTGGLVGAYAVLRIDRGSISLDAVGTDRDFRTGTVPLADLGPDYAERYGTGGPTLWSAAGLSPDWPSAGTVMARLWEAQGGGHLDGVIGLDPRAIAGLLSVTGPVTVQGRRIASANVADFVMRDEYVESDVPQTERKDVLADLALALYQRVVAGGYATVAMGRALGSAAAGGHLQVMSTNPVEQAVLQPMRVSGALPAVPGVFLDVVMNNAAGNKVDYYLRRKVSYVRTGSRAGRLTVTLTNTVDPRAVPPIVTGRLDEPTIPGDPGQTRLLLSLYVGVGDEVRSV